MIAFTVNARKIKELEKLLNGNQKKLRRELATAVNATARKTQSLMAKQIGRELSTAQKNIKQTIAIVKKATPTGEAKSPSATVRQSKTKRIPLRDFGARQNKSGVSYKISKTAGRKQVKGAFQGPKPGTMKASWRGRVFKRTGASRLPIVQLFGPSPWGVFAKKKLKRPTVQDSRVELMLQINRRIRFLKLKQSGAI